MTERLARQAFRWFNSYRHSNSSSRTFDWRWPPSLELHHYPLVWNGTEFLTLGRTDLLYFYFSFNLSFLSLLLLPLFLPSKNKLVDNKCSLYYYLKEAFLIADKEISPFDFIFLRIVRLGVDRRRVTRGMTMGQKVSGGVKGLSGREGSHSSLGGNGGANKSSNSRHDAMPHDFTKPSRLEALLDMPPTSR